MKGIRLLCYSFPEALLIRTLQELHMTGCAVLTDALAVIVVEGGYKAQKKYAHIVLNRIRWEQAGGNEEDNDEGCAL